MDSSDDLCMGVAVRSSPISHLIRYCKWEHTLHIFDVDIFVDHLAGGWVLFLQRGLQSSKEQNSEYGCLSGTWNDICVALWHHSVFYRSQLNEWHKS